MDGPRRGIWESSCGGRHGLCRRIRFVPELHLRARCAHWHGAVGLSHRRLGVRLACRGERCGVCRHRRRRDLCVRCPNGGQAVELRSEVRSSFSDGSERSCLHRLVRRERICTRRTHWRQVVELSHPRSDFRLARRGERAGVRPRFLGKALRAIRANWASQVAFWGGIISPTPQ